MAKANRRIMGEMERMRIVMYLAYGGFHYRTIAKRVYGRGDYTPSDSEVSRVGKIAREEGLSSLDWRNGKSTESRRVLSVLGKTNVDSKQKARMVV